VIHTRASRPLHVTAKNVTAAEIAEDKGWGLGKGIDFSATPTLADVIAGAVLGRRSDDEMTCFINNLGLGSQFAAAGALAYRKAKDAGRGHELPTEWFTQDVHP
jgi:alanine dehydrogenase